MRSGLVAIGVAFLVVGGVALGSLYLAPNPTIESEHDSTSTVQVNPTIWTFTPPLWGENGTGPTFTLHWTSTVPVQITLLAAAETCTDGGAHCAPPMCPCPVRNWSTGLAGSWSSSGAPSYPYELEGLSKGIMDGILTVYSSSVALTLPAGYTVQKVAGTVAGAATVLVGAIALFLGLFLRPNPYSGPPPVIPLSREDLRELEEAGNEDEDEDDPGFPKPPVG